MDYFLVAMTIALLLLNWGIYTRLTDGVEVSKNIQLQLTGSSQDRYLIKVLKNLIATASAFAIIILVILVLLPIMYNLGRGWVRLPYILVFFFTLAMVVNFAELYCVGPHGAFRYELIVKRAKTFNVISATIACSFFLFAF
jgi:hypothetical protein